MSKHLIHKMSRLNSRSNRRSAERLSLKSNIKRLRKEGSPMSEIFANYVKLFSASRLDSKVRVRKVCQLTGRSRGYYGFFGLSRMQVLKAFDSGLLSGIKKSSW